jgi:Flp pilus assembly protein TadG
VAFPLLLLVAVGLVQFALYLHAEHVVTGAVQDGARVAAEDGATLADGVRRAQDLLTAGLGPTARDVRVQATDGGDTVLLEASGQMRLVIPWVGDNSVPLRARSLVSKERFRPWGGGAP